MTEDEWLGAEDPLPLLASLAGVAGGAWPSPGDSEGQSAALEGLARLSLSCVCCRTDCSGLGGLCPAYRKLRMFAVACCRRVLPLLPRTVCEPALEMAEQYTEGQVEESAWLRPAAIFDGIRRSRFPKYATPDDGAWTAVYCAVHRRWEARFDEALAVDRWRLAGTVARYAADSGGAGEPSVQADFLRDIFGNPFRPVSVDSAWLTATVTALARAAYEERILPAGALDCTRLAILGDALEESGCTDRALLDHLRGPGPHVRGCAVLDLILSEVR